MTTDKNTAPADPHPTLETLTTLRRDIAERVAQSRACRERIHATKGPDRAKAWADKRSLAWVTRHKLLALAFLRGMPLARVEAPPKNPDSPRWRDREKPHMGAIADFAGYGDRSEGVTLALAWSEGAPSAAAALLAAEREARRAEKLASDTPPPLEQCA